MNREDCQVPSKFDGTCDSILNFGALTNESTFLKCIPKGGTDLKWRMIKGLYTEALEEWERNLFNPGVKHR